MTRLDANVIIAERIDISPAALKIARGAVPGIRELVDGFSAIKPNQCLRYSVSRIFFGIKRNTTVVCPTKF